MASLLQLRDRLALLGRADAQQLSHQLSQPLALTEAMLERLVAMGKATRVTDDASACLTGSCKSCPQSKGCAREVYQLL